MEFHCVKFIVLPAAFCFFTRPSTNAQVRSIRNGRRKLSVEDEATVRV